MTYAVEINNLNNVYECLNRLSIAYELIGERNKSIEYKEKAIAIYKKLNQQKIVDLEEKKKI